jgi:hypothetical protein
MDRIGSDRFEPLPVVLASPCLRAPFTVYTYPYVCMYGFVLAVLSVGWMYRWMEWAWVAGNGTPGGSCRAFGVSSKEGQR